MLNSMTILQIKTIKILKLVFPLTRRCYYSSVVVQSSTRHSGAESDYAT